MKTGRWCSIFAARLVLFLVGFSVVVFCLLKCDPSRRYQIHVGSSYISLNGNASTWAELKTEIERQDNFVRIDLMFDDSVCLKNIEEGVFRLTRKAFPEFGFSVTNRPVLDIIIQGGDLVFSSADVLCFKVANQKVLLDENPLTYQDCEKFLKNRRMTSGKIRIILEIMDTTTAVDLYRAIDIVQRYATEGVVWGK